MLTQEISGAIHVEETRGCARVRETIRVGVPLPRGLVFDANDVVVLDPCPRQVPHQCRVLASWSDRSIKWLLVDALVDVAAKGHTILSLCRRQEATGAASNPPPDAVTVVDRQGMFVVNTGAAEFRLASDTSGSLEAMIVGSANPLAATRAATRLRATNGLEYTPSIDRMRIEETGPVRSTLLVEGGFARGARRIPLVFKLRLTFLAGSSCVQNDFLIRNPRAANHAAGLWDLRDRGSFHFNDLSILVRPAGAVREVQWYAEDADCIQRGNYASLNLYQDSSGGDNWDSPNHVDAAGRLTVTQPGYRVTARSTDVHKLLAEGRRATPCMQVSTDAGWIAVTTQHFWQNFPKALRFEEGNLSIGLFPGESRAGFELQGGEQKRHIIWIDFGLREQASAIAPLQHPLLVSIDPLWVERTGAIASFTAAKRDTNEAYLKYVDSIVEGQNSFLHKREVVDEYGWRNFGDLYADHEAVGHCGPKPMVSHYNNQYDFIYGALVQYLRTGDVRWQQLMEDAARHTIDIDMYHTEEDRAAYNGGLFWHTDHYKAAETCTHRTYSHCNGTVGYGGGPSNEHNYTSGLLHYYYLSGDAEAADAVLSLANWVIAMDDGSRNLLGVVDAGPTGLASQTVSMDYHGPGRGAGNSINALLDAYELSADRGYMCKAEELVQRCIHPADDIGELDLGEPEHHWSYLVFLQVLGKYLDVKTELEEFDYYFHYARESLLHYSGWLLANEVPYKDVLHKVEIPTETWPAHDIRKCHVLHLAALYADDHHRAAFRERAAFFFERCMQDLLGFETAYLTRPLVILCVYGYIHAYFQEHEDGTQVASSHAYAFGEPRGFRPQRGRIREALVRKLRLVSTEIKRLLRDRVARR
jgi:exo-rhamnogalacturonan lyase-like protein